MVSSLIMHAVLFDEKCVDFPKEWFLGENANALLMPLDIIKEGLHGDSPEEDWEELLRICTEADAQIAQVADK